MTEFAQTFAQFQDHLAPRLDVYEQAIYLYVLRHTHVEGKLETVIGFKSARKKLAFGIGKAGTPPSEAVVYEKLRGLVQKGCLKVLSSERAGTRVQIILPIDIPGLIHVGAAAIELALHEQDFFTIPKNRKLILERDQWRCFYCQLALDEHNHVVEHVVSRPKGNNSFLNVVAACRRCNNRKSSTLAEDFLRMLYREAILSKAGELRPIPLEAPSSSIE